MAILVDTNTRLLVQGITGKHGSFHTSTAIAYGTTVVAGVVPGKGGMTSDHGVPIFNTVREAVDATNRRLADGATGHQARTPGTRTASGHQLVPCPPAPTKKAFNR